MSLDQSFFPHPWSTASWNGVGELDNEYVLTIRESDGKIDAFALYLLNPLENLAHLLKLLVIPEMRGAGLGVKLLATSFIELDRRGFIKKYLEVAVSNHCAIETYKKAGMCEINRIKKFYSSGEDAVVMMSSN
ncbi:MAG: GNAT family N-acetyltransferase [Bacteriovoracaceae bacterium]|nr:GNAT family N-acetyltransferase [Bacteriovoracaceae bacterium]